jgi:anti-sigma factor RsiW
VTEHLTPAQVSALADGELADSELSAAKDHIEQCLPCAKSAVGEWLLKAAVAKAGRRYEMASDFQDRIADLVSREPAPEAQRWAVALRKSRRLRGWSAVGGWAAAAMLLLVLGWFGVVEYRAHNSLSSERAALATEACDLHIATLAANQPPQVVSSDRHTVKPWFQGKLPFSFNLPETLPADTTLDGANLAYLHDHPVAQLLFSIGRHRVSVFAAEKNGGGALGPWKTTHDGFQVAGFETDDLEVIAVSDVDPARMATLINALQAAQTPH